MAVHWTLAPSPSSQIMLSRMPLLTMWGARISRFFSGSSSAQVALPLSMVAPTKSCPAPSISVTSSRPVMSPAWFSTAIVTPASSARVRTFFSTATVSAMRAWMPPGVDRSSPNPSTQRATVLPVPCATLINSAEQLLGRAPLFVEARRSRTNGQRADMQFDPGVAGQLSHGGQVLRANGFHTRRGPRAAGHRPSAPPRIRSAAAPSIPARGGRNCRIRV